MPRRHGQCNGEPLRRGHVGGGRLRGVRCLPRGLLLRRRLYGARAVRPGLLSRDHGGHVASELLRLQ